MFQGSTPTRGRHAASRPGQHLKIPVTGAQITQVCAARSATSSGKDLRQNGGYLRASTMDSNHAK